MWKTQLIKRSVDREQLCFRYVLFSSFISYKTFYGAGDMSLMKDYFLIINTHVCGRDFVVNRRNYEIIRKCVQLLILESKYMNMSKSKYKYASFSPYLIMFTCVI